MQNQVVNAARSPRRRPGTGRKLGGLLVFLLLLLTALTAAAAAPPNDECAGAQIIPPGGPFPLATPVVDITDATLNAQDPPLLPIYDNLVSRSTWYVFQPSAASLYTISTCADGSTVADPIIAIYSSPAGCNGPFSRLEFADEVDACESMTIPLLADSTYYIVVWKYDEGNPDDGKNQLQLAIDRLIPPPNDTCADAVPAQVNIPIHGSTAGAANNYQIVGTSAFWGLDQTPSSAAGRDVVYSFTAPEAGTYSFKVFNYDVLQNLVLYVAPGPACPAGSFPIGIANCLAAANRSGVNSAEEILCLPMSAGQQVFAIVDDQPATGQAINRGGPFDFEVTRCIREQETNNSPATASRLATGVEGSISPVGDVDFYALGSFPPGWRAFALVDGEAARNADFDLRITTTVDTLEYDNDNNDSLFGASSANIAGTPLNGGPAFVEVSYLGMDDSEPYRLYAAVQPPIARAVQETEPNETLEQANTAEENYFYGVLSGASPSQDADLFSFNVAEGDLIFLSLDGDPYRTNAPINARLELLDSSGSTLVIVNDNASSSVGGTNVATNTLSAFGPLAPAEGIVYRAAVEGTFYARVSIAPTAAGSSGAGAYLLSITKNGITGSSGFNNGPVLTNIAVTSPVSAGFTGMLTGFIWETDVGDGATLIVSWGDGATNVVNYPAPGRIYLSLPHVYTTNTNYTVNLRVTDRLGATDVASTTVQVRPYPAAATLLDIDILPNGHISLQLQGTPNAFYLIEKADVLGSWSPLGTGTAGANGRFSIEDTAPHPNSRFYRAVGQ